MRDTTVNENPASQLSTLNSSLLTPHSYLLTPKYESVVRAWQSACG